MIKQLNGVLGRDCDVPLWNMYCLFIFHLLFLNPEHNEVFITEHIVFLSDETAADSTARHCCCAAPHASAHTCRTQAHTNLAVFPSETERERKKKGDTH